MKTINCLLALVTALGTALAEPPPITVSLQPEEGGFLTYLPIASEQASDSTGSGLLGIRFQIQNNAPTELTLNAIVVTAGGSFLLNEKLPKPLEANGQSSYTMTPDEAIRLLDPAPASAEILLFVEGYDDPKVLTRPLAPYAGPTPGGAYQFPGSVDDLEPDEVWVPITRHTGGSQFFGYDFGTRVLIDGVYKSVRSGVDSHENASRYCWGQPVYAMADGVVLRSSSGWPDNPFVGDRDVQEMDNAAAGDGSDVASVVRMGGSRAARVDGFQNHTISVWDCDENGRDLSMRDEIEADLGDDVSITALNSQTLVTASSHPTTGDLRVKIYEFDSNASRLSLAGGGSTDAVSEPAIANVSSTHFATAGTDSSGELDVRLWRTHTNASGNGKYAVTLSSVTAETASGVGIVALSDEFIVTSFRNGDGRLSAIVWEIVTDVRTGLVRRGEMVGDIIEALPAVRPAIIKADSLHFDTAIDRANDGLRVQRWEVAEDGSIVNLLLTSDAGEPRAFALTPSIDNGLAVPLITAGGDAKTIIWRAPDEEEEQDSFVRWGESSESPAVNTTGIAAAQLENGVYFHTYAETSGSATIVTHRAAHGGGNNLVIRHGDCRMLYAHFQHGSLNPALETPGTYVSAGQFLGRIGNTGSSAGPHLHIHASRMPTSMSDADAIEDEANGTLESQLLGYRPIPFHCASAATLESLADLGGSPHHFGTLEGHGLYFEAFGIRPTWRHALYIDSSINCDIQTGRQDCVFNFPFTYGPFQSVAPALTRTCHNRELHIRGGSYDEALTFDQLMTIRSYDGTAVIGR